MSASVVHERERRGELRRRWFREREREVFARGTGPVSALVVRDRKRRGVSASVVREREGGVGECCSRECLRRLFTS